VTLAELTVFIDAPPAFERRARWALDTMLAPLGRRVALLRDPASSDGAALAYAAAPVAGVPTIPCSAEAQRLFAAGAPLPAGAFAACTCRDGSAVAAFPADPGAGFAVSFDLVASAFALLACWDEHTDAARDKHGRLPYSASVFAANPELRIDEPVVDRYVELLRSALSPRLAELAVEPLPATGWAWDAASTGTGHALALTHDLDNLWRWTRRGFIETGRRSARALRHGDDAALRREIGDLSDWAVHHLPRRTDPYWTFPTILGGEDARGVSSTFFVIARHTDRTDGTQPEAYRLRLPQALALLRRHGREIGLHGNHSDRLGLDPLSDDRRLLARRAQTEVLGIRYHYLRCLYHETLPLLEDARFSYDTSLAFAEHEGFRCGCSFPFRPYHLGQERPLDLVELPLAVMDGTLQEPHHRGLDADAAERAAAAVLGKAGRSGGAVSLLWHNNRFDPHAARGYDGVYWRLVEAALDGGAWVTSAGAVVERWREITGMSAPHPLQATDTDVCDARIAATGRGGRGA
jgi:hypothetical protein